MSRSQRLKGINAERELVRYFKDERGWTAHRTANSGGQPGHDGDVVLGMVDGIGPTTIEVKRRAHGFKQLYDWLEGVDALAVRADNKEWLMVVRIRDYEP